MLVFVYCVVIRYAYGKGLGDGLTEEMIPFVAPSVLPISPIISPQPPSPLFPFSTPSILFNRSLASPRLPSPRHPFVSTNPHQTGHARLSPHRPSSVFTFSPPVASLPFPPYPPRFTSSYLHLFPPTSPPERVYRMSFV